MGAIGESMVAFARPLIDQTDGSLPKIQWAMEISRHCWNVAVAPPDKRAEAMAEAADSLGMDAVEFADFQRTVLDPMVRRHEEMFPELHEELRERQGRGDTGPRVAESMLAYAKPLIERADPTVEGRNMALAIAQDCWNIAILSPEERPAAIEEVGRQMGVSDGAFHDFKTFVFPMMLLRHKAMFPELHRRKSAPYAGTDRYGPCPCGSGTKYKFCCGRSVRG